MYVEEVERKKWHYMLCWLVRFGDGCNRNRKLLQKKAVKWVTANRIEYS